jgi:hypothetical protein
VVLPREALEPPADPLDPLDSPNDPPCPLDPLIPLELPVLPDPECKSLPLFPDPLELPDEPDEP